MRKAQIFSIDVIFAISLLVVLFLLSLLVSDSLYKEIDIQEQRQELSEATQTALNVLLKRAGDPSNWSAVNNASNMSSFGLVSNANRLDYQKLTQFFQFANSTENYTIVKQALGLDRAFYNFSFNVSYSNGTLFNVSNSTIPTQLTTASSERYALLNNSLVIVRLIVWIEGQSL